MYSVKDIIQDYNSIVKVIDKDASKQNNRAYGGVIRSVKGKLQEHITEEIIKIAWNNLNGNQNRLEINSEKIKLPIKESYIKNIKNKKIKKKGMIYLKKLVLIDGNSIMNRAFYGIMGSKMLTTKDGKYTNAVYGFLAILFKLLDDINPEYLVVAFDLKAPTARHKLYEGYKANRKGMPNELAEQMPIIKKILRAMNIDIVEMEGYEADDILRNFI